MCLPAEAVEQAGTQRCCLRERAEVVDLVQMSQEVEMVAADQYEAVRLVVEREESALRSEVDCKSSIRCEPRRWRLTSSSWDGGPSSDRRR